MTNNITLALLLPPLARSLVRDGQLVDDIEVLDHIAELSEGYLAVKVLIGLHDGAINELLELSIVQVVTHHHLEDLEELTVRDIAIVVDVVNLEGET